MMSFSQLSAVKNPTIFGAALVQLKQNLALLILLEFWVSKDLMHASCHGQSHQTLIMILNIKFLGLAKENLR